MIAMTEDLDTNRYKSGATCNACKLCTPLGACMVYAGIKNCVPILHGSQGCSTYIRRYMISHFREPVDIASSSFTEEDTVYGGAKNLALGIKNLIAQYHPEVIGVATTCLSETIGEDIPGIVGEIKRGLTSKEGVELVQVSTPSYTGTHTDGFHATCLALVQEFAKEKSHQPENASRTVALFPGMLSPADFRHYRELIESLGLECTMLPDYSDTLDGGAWADYHRIPEGGTSKEAIAAIPYALASIECGATLPHYKQTAGRWLKQRHSVAHHATGLPIGIRETDSFIAALEHISGKSLPAYLDAERGRLTDSLFDAHKYLFGKRVAIYGDPDMVIGLTSMVSEFGMTPVLCATGGKTPGFKEEVERVLMLKDEPAPEIVAGADHVNIHHHCEALQPDIIIGSSKGYKISRALNIPLIRVGFPVHDRMGGQRLLHIGYRGAQRLFDQIVNTVLDQKQAANEVGYTYL